MSRYEFLLFFHVVSVIVWLGAGTTLALTAVFAQRSGDPSEFRRLGAFGRWLGPRVFAPAALGALVFGILLVVDGSWTFDPLWIRLGLAAFAVSLLVNVGLRFPTLRRLQRAAREAGPAAPEVARSGRQLGLLARLELAVLYLAVADMVAKPTSSDGWTLVGGAAILGLVLLSVAVGALRLPKGAAE